jgi:hypothetical protein
MEDDEIKGVLFILKEQLVRDGDLAPNHRKILRNITALLSEDLSLLGLLYKWDFLEKQVPYLLRNYKSREAGLRIGIEILQLREASVPNLFLTREFGFFVSELLYENLDCCDLLVEFCGAAAQKNALFVNLLYDCGFFILLNAVVDKCVAKFYSAIFSHGRYKADSLARQKCSSDVFYEIQRRYFDPEIVFKDRSQVVLKELPAEHRPLLQIYKNIFDELYSTSFHALLGLGLEMNLHLCNYCAWDYLLLCGSSDLRALVMSSNHLAMRLYRKMLRLALEEPRGAIYYSKIEDGDLMINIARALESKDLLIRMEAALILYHYHEIFDWNIDGKTFTEPRIRRIFLLLEHSPSTCGCLRGCLEDESCLAECDTSRILLLLSKLYAVAPAEYFYKPSYVVLMNLWHDVFTRHSCMSHPFFRLFFADFAVFLRRNCYNFARIFFPFRRKVRSDKDSAIRNPEPAGQMQYVDDFDMAEDHAILQDENESNGDSTLDNTLNSKSCKIPSRNTILDSDEDCLDQ